jgi:hypothetical protein
MANDQEATNEILYSWDEGLSWETIKLDEKVHNNNYRYKLGILLLSHLILVSISSYTALNRMNKESSFILISLVCTKKHVKAKKFQIH